MLAVFSKFQGISPKDGQRTAMSSSREQTVGNMTPDRPDSAYYLNVKVVQTS